MFKLRLPDTRSPETGRASCLESLGFAALEPTALKPERPSTLLPRSFAALKPFNLKAFEAKLLAFQPLKP